MVEAFSSLLSGRKDWIDNLGRRSPQELTPGAEELQVGQPFLVFRIVDFKPEQHISGITTARAERLYGRLAITYRVTRLGTGGRLSVRLNASLNTRRSQLLAPILGLGDTIMMRAQLLNLKRLAERDARNQLE